MWCWTSLKDHLQGIPFTLREKTEKQKIQIINKTGGSPAGGDSQRANQELLVLGLMFYSAHHLILMWNKVKNKIEYIWLVCQGKEVRVYLGKVELLYEECSLYI